MKEGRDGMEDVKINELMEAARLSGENRLYIAGAGKYGEFFGRYFDKHNIAWEGYVDKRTSLQEVNGKPVYSYGETDTDGYYVISTCNYKNEIAEELKSAGIRPERIISYDNPELIYELYAEWIDWKKYTGRLEAFQGLHEGGRCFIIGNGPSLKLEDLERLKQEISFGSNSVYALYTHTAWRPTYYCAWDPVFCKEMMSEKGSMLRLMEGCEAAFTSLFSDAVQYRDDEDMGKLYYMRSMYKLGDDGLPMFSGDCAECVYTSGTITYGMLQMAVYMGFHEIYLLGVDCSYSVEMHNDNTVTVTDMTNHMGIMEEEEKRFYDESFNRYGVCSIAYIDRHRLGYQAARRYAESHGIKIYNATRGGRLEVFERVDFDSLF